MLNIINNIKVSSKLLLIITIITGVVYPLIITGLSQILFPKESNGSLIIKNQKIIGSELIGQSFDQPKYFLSRPSATQYFAYNPMYSGGSNLGPTNLVLIQRIATKIKELQKLDPNNRLSIPTDLVTTSGSGLDPHITPETAFYQANRIAKIRNIPIYVVNNLINQAIEYPQFRILGEARINVLKLNLALDDLLQD